PENFRHFSWTLIGYLCFQSGLRNNLSKRETPDSKILLIFQLSASQSELLSSEFEETIASTLFIVCELVFHDNWYETTVATQKSLLNMMLRTSKTFSFNIYNCYTGTVEGFST
ncbi:unnamed protein product, partial [Heterotrigona itama]